MLLKDGAFHGDNTGSNPVGDANSNLHLTENALIWHGHRWAQKCSATCAAERVEHCVYMSFQANLVGTNGHKPLADEGYFFRVFLPTKSRTTFV